MSFTICRDRIIAAQRLSSRPEFNTSNRHWLGHRVAPLINSREKKVSIHRFGTQDEVDIKASEDEIPENIKKYLDENLKPPPAENKPKIDIDYLAVFGIVVSVASFYLGLSAQISEVANRSNDQREQIKDIAVDVRAFIGKEAAVRSEQLNVLNAKINSLEKKLEKKQGLFF